MKTNANKKVKSLNPKEAVENLHSWLLKPIRYKGNKIKHIKKRNFNCFLSKSIV